MINNPGRLLISASIILFAFSLVVYGAGIHFMEAQPCKHVGPQTALNGIAIGIFSSGVLGGRALCIRSLSSWLILVFSLLIISVMIIVAGALGSACSGI